jgi:N-acetylglucosamine-6-phosphate deacetylase
MLTKTPATVMGLDGYGSIKKGYNAIFTVLDKDLNVVNVEI